MSITEDLRQINEKFGEAERAKGAKAKKFFDRHLSDNLLFRRASGKINTKKQFIEALENPNLVYHEIKTNVIKISITEDNMNALVHAVIYAKITDNGKNIEGHFMNIRFFQMENEIWKLCSWYNYVL